MSTRLGALLRMVAATVLVGLAVGAVVGGVGGRLAMRVLFLTSPDHVKGLTSDDGFEIGRFSPGDTLGLVVLTAVLGVVAALLYQAARPFVAVLGRAEVPVMAAFFGVVGGALLVHRDGVDFTVLEPAALAIAIFVAICAGFGALTGWWLRRVAERPTDRARWFALGPPLLALVFPPALVAAVLAAATRWAADAAADQPDAPAWRVLRAGALAVMAVVFAAAAVKLALDTAYLT